MIPKIAFFDIDGTILAFGARKANPAVLDALVCLQDNGCLLFLATGRAPFMIPDFSPVHFDGILSFNGSLCYASDGVIYTDPLHKGDMHTVIANAKRMGVPVMVAARERAGCNRLNDDLERYMSFARAGFDVVDEGDPIYEGEVYQLMVPVTKEAEEGLLDQTKHLKTARWWERAVDVIPAGCGKARGMTEILAHYGIAREEAVAFGDGGNDVDMLKFAGLGVAMGNADREVKAAADYVTGSCGEDGVVSALRRFGFI